ncbi:hypothetical protein P245_03845 [Comamonas thiooxydans]|uniref:Uncharacterized protein n=1 Tax=Comamonas thiooxydans TaxID=363952 RepID=A0A0E3BJ72_9BURK|nr:hypothetical protein P245_03845 [Comamonas thiooxydans]
MIFSELRCQPFRFVMGVGSSLAVVAGFMR